MPDLSCSTRELLVTACGISFPAQGSNPGPLSWEHEVLATGPLRKSLSYFSVSTCRFFCEELWLESWVQPSERGVSGKGVSREWLGRGRKPGWFQMPQKARAAVNGRVRPLLCLLSRLFPPVSSSFSLCSSFQLVQWMNVSILDLLTKQKTSWIVNTN